ncbi:hypothetical protein C2845_PM14G03220 [Panicum miliaceum]|uniref:Uncharacterized protein n=1 Tax=Panicum miliaceum TaxID=4540 RepID=A0A3L6PKR4_PANMI|nr:hypothetical protein C2845_PM14G03220 [Panicum miliaceum]
MFTRTSSFHFGYHSRSVTLLLPHHLRSRISIAALLACLFRSLHGVTNFSLPTSPSYAALLNSSISNLRFTLPGVGRPVAVVLPGSRDGLRAAAGATLGELYHAVGRSSRSLAFRAGSCSTVGLGGTISGGGFGLLARKHGLAPDNVLDAALVDASGGVLDRREMGDDVFSDGNVVSVSFTGQVLAPKRRAMSALRRSFPELRLTASELAETSWLDATAQFADLATAADLPNRGLGSKQYSKGKSDYVRSPIPRRAVAGVVRHLSMGPREGGYVILDPYGVAMARFGSGDTLCSRFPRDILHHIHSLLPLRDAARAACSSRTFLHSWRCRPILTLNRHILGSNANAPQESFSCRIDNILRNYSGIGIKIFVLDLYAELGPLRKLTSLCLRSVRISGDELEYFLSNSPALKQLDLSECQEIMCLKIPCVLLQLHCLKVSYCWKLRAIESKARNLFSFILIGERVEVSLGENNASEESVHEPCRPRLLCPHGIAIQYAEP